MQRRNRLLHGTSGHADQKGLLDWVSAIEPKPSIVFVNHGSEQSCEDFKDLLVQKKAIGRKRRTAAPSTIWPSVR